MTKPSEQDKQAEQVTIIVVGRDKFSTVAQTLRTVDANTPAPHQTVCILGGCPARIRRELETEFAGKVKFVFKDGFISQTISRQMGLELCSTPLAVLLDADVDVRKDWLVPLIDCQKETGAAMVQPLTLEDDLRIHAGANYFFITRKNGRRLAMKELGTASKIVFEGTNLKRQMIDFSELHALLVDVKKALELGFFADDFREFGDMNAGLTIQKAGLLTWFEPRSLVNFRKSSPIEPIDIRFHIWRWDIREAIRLCQYFEKKWDLDVSEHGEFIGFLMYNQNKVGYFARAFPSAMGIKLDRLIHLAVNVHKVILGKLASPWKKFWKRKLGFYEWMDCIAKS